MHAGQTPAKASFWLLQAPNSLSGQSRYEPDGTGIGTFDRDGTARVSKQPIAAWQDQEFAYQAKHLESTTFLAHVRYASTGGHSVENTHPFVQDGRLFAHNGVIGDLPQLEERLRTLGVFDLLLGQTDSERIFALITGEIRVAQGDVSTGIIRAMTWMAKNIPIYSLNFVLTTATDLWALRYPETHELFLHQRKPGLGQKPDALIVHSDRIRAHSPELSEREIAIVATERMNSDQRWRLLEPGELIHIDRSLKVHSNIVLPMPPTHLMKLEELSSVAAASQHPVR